MGETAESARPKLEAYAKRRGLMFYRDWSLPPATQLLRHGFMQEVPSVAIGNLGGGLANANLAHFAYRTEGGDHPYFTVVAVGARDSISFALRVLCHDRDLDEDVRANPEKEVEMVDLDDRAVRLESDAFLGRYTLATDHHQDELRVWQLFDPRTLDWLTTDAPRDFSFELQDGGLCCFVPGIVADDAALDALCAAAARIVARVAEVSSGVASLPQPGGSSAVAGGREEILARELAEHPFAEPPESVKAAARKIGGLLVGDDEWRLGAEAFFRSYAETNGLKRIAVGEFRAAHPTFFIADDVSHVARGRIPHADLEGFLILADDRDGDRRGQMVLVVDLPPWSNGYAFAVMPETDAARRDGIDVVANDQSILVWGFDEGARKRSRESIDGFLARAGPFLAKVVAAAGGG